MEKILPPWESQRQHTDTGLPPWDQRQSPVALILLRWEIIPGPMDTGLPPWEFERPQMDTLRQQ